MDQDVVELEISMHDIYRVKGLAARDNLLNTTHCESLLEAPVQIQEGLQGATIGKLQDAVVVALRLDDFHLLDDVGTLDHRQEDDLSAEGEHALFPVLRVTFSFLVDPVIRGDLAGILLLVHPE